jgi:superfamily I DNA and/or RNA helicase
MAKVLETSENGRRDYLQSHYYRTTADKLMDYIPNVCEAMNCKVLQVNTDFNEITAYNENYDITLKVVMTEINKTSVDVFINSRFLFDFGKTKAIILEFFNKIAQEFEFLGVSLNRDK